MNTTAAVFKRLVPCFRCDDQFYFTLRAIADAHHLTCPVCRSEIDLWDSRYKSLRMEVRNTLAEIVSP
jgi:hypothetical protein